MSDLDNNLEITTEKCWRQATKRQNALIYSKLHMVLRRASGRAERLTPVCTATSQRACPPVSKLSVISSKN